METVLQLLASGLSLGFIYCLVAIEYSLLFNTCGLLNFGHEKYITLGAYVFVGTAVLQLGLGTIPSMGVALLIMAAVGVCIALLVFIPLRKFSRLYSALGTLALSMMVREGIRLIWGSYPFTYHGYLTGVVKFGGITLPRVYCYIISISIVILVAQNLLFHYTKVGKGVRAVSQDKDTAALMGINVKFVIVFSAALSMMICCITAFFTIPLLGININMSSTIGTKGFVAGVIGGFGNLNGAILGGLIVGLLESLYLICGFPALYKDIMVFALFILILLFKPNGILNRKPA